MGEETARPSFAGKMAEAARSETPTWTTDCLEPDDLIALIERGTDSPDVLPRLAHVTTCAYCRQEWDTMEATLKQAEKAVQLQAALPVVKKAEQRLASPPFRRRLFAPAFGFALGAAVVVWIAWIGVVRPLRTEVTDARRQLAQQQAVLEQRRAGGAPASPTPVSAEEYRAVVKRLAQARKDYTLLGRESARRIDALESRVAQMARRDDGEELALKVLKRAAELTEQARGVLHESQRTMGGTGSGTPAFKVLRPDAALLSNNRIEFRWEAMEGTTDYVVVVLDSSFRQVAKSPPVRETKWKTTLPRSAAGTLTYYEWHVIARKGGQKVGQSTPAKFAILDARNLVKEVKTKR